MATINLGSIKFNWQGAYNGATAYAVDDVVSYNGSSYICKLASTGNLPTNTTYWDQMSSAGTDGTDLTTTLTTQGDIVYRNASGLARLGAGVSGQFLKTQGTGANPTWGDLSAEAGKYSFYATINPDVTVPVNTVTEFVGNSDYVNNGSKYSTSTGRYTPGETGTYWVWFQWTPNNMTSTSDQPESWFHVNGTGTRFGQGYQPGGSPNGWVQVVSGAVITLSSPTDYISAFVYQNGGTGRQFQQDRVFIGGYKLA